MQWQRFFLLIFLIPTFLYGLDQKECSKILDKVLPEWKRHTELIQEFQATGSLEGIQLLKESLACCQRAVHYCDTLLNNIASKPKSKRKEQWRVDLKNRCEKDKEQLIGEINQLQYEIGRVESNISAMAFYRVSLEKVASAQNKV